MRLFRGLHNFHVEWRFRHAIELARRNEVVAVGPPIPTPRNGELDSDYPTTSSETSAPPRQIGDPAGFAGAYLRASDLFRSDSHTQTSPLRLAAIRWFRGLPTAAAQLARETIEQQVT
jgi:hypothetical protein